MKLFSSILVPLDGSRIAARSIGCATWLASRLGARLHILSATVRELPAREELLRLQVPEEHWPLIGLHQVPEIPADAVLAAVWRHKARLVVITACGHTAETPDPKRQEFSPPVGTVARAIIERSTVPVLLLPPNYREALPWERALVPVSGDAQLDEALAFAVQLANALDLEVHVAHVADSTAGEESLAMRARYADALHYEYAQQLEELVSRALPQCSPEECRRIKDVALCHGDVAAELLQLIERKHISLLVVGWHGRFMSGHARILKHLIQALTTPVLLLRTENRMPLRLKVGEEIE